MAVFPFSARFLWSAEFYSTVEYFIARRHYFRREGAHSRLGENGAISTLGNPHAFELLQELLYFLVYPNCEDIRTKDRGRRVLACKKKQMAGPP